MSKEKILITEVTITKAGQIKLFQIKLPKNTVRVIAIDTDTRLAFPLGDAGHLGSPIITGYEIPGYKSTVISGVPDARRELIPNLDFKQSQAVGELLLQSLEKANIFYSAIVRADEANLAFGDPSAVLFPITSYSHKIKTTPKKVDVHGSTTIIQGLFKDRFGAALKRDVTYILKVFVWIEIKNKSPEQ